MSEFWFLRICFKITEWGQGMTKCEYCGKVIYLFGKYGWTDENSVHYDCYKKLLVKGKGNKITYVKTV